MGTVFGAQSYMQYARSIRAQHAAIAAMEEARQSMQLARFLRCVFHQLFAPVLQRHGRDAPSLVRVDACYVDEQNHLRLTALFADGSRQDLAIHETVGVDADPGTLANAIMSGAQAAWSEEYESHCMREWERSMAAAVSEAYATIPVESAEEIRASYERMRDHIRQFHRRPVEPPLRWWNDPEIARAPRLETATEVNCRAQNEQRRLGDMMRQAYERMQNTLFMGSPQHWAEAAAGAGFFDFGEPGTAEARAKGLALLKENLTPAQRAQYEQHRYFDVKGGTTGRTYRIHHGRQMNIHELRKNGKPKCGWCFLPAGGLVAGDVMLAQKTTLEVAEHEALRVANRFIV